MLTRLLPILTYDSRKLHSFVWNDIMLSIRDYLSLTEIAFKFLDTKTSPFSKNEKKQWKYKNVKIKWFLGVC